MNLIKTTEDVKNYFSTTANYEKCKRYWSERFQGQTRPWEYIPCDNCKIRIAMEEEAASVRPPTCEICGEPTITGKSVKCRYCAASGVHKKAPNGECMECGVPIRKIKSSVSLCSYCRTKNQYRKKYHACRSCGKGISNTVGYCWGCKQQRKNAKNSSARM